MIKQNYVEKRLLLPKKFIKKAHNEFALEDFNRLKVNAQELERFRRKYA